MQDQHSSLSSNFVNKENIEYSQLDQVKILAQNSLQQFASTPSFETDLRLVFGANVDLNPLKTSWINEEVIFPTLEIVARAEINNANGAFSQQTGKIYLAQEFLLSNQNNPDTINNVLLEEYGHFIDSQLNIDDAPGDEGAIFAAVVRGENISQRELSQLRNEDDTVTVTLDGETIEIEQSFTELINGLGGSGDLNSDEGFGENFLPRHDDSLGGDTSTQQTTTGTDGQQTTTDTNTQQTTTGTDGQQTTTETDDEINRVFEVNLTGVFPDGINFYGETYNKLYINNNGNITFDAPLATFTPTSITSYPIIAPFFADVDTRENNIEPSLGGTSQGTNLVYYDVNQDAGEITITWDDVGKFPNETIPNAFQLILRAPQEGADNEGEGNFEIEFRYEEIQWTVGGASDDTYARVGFSGGNIANFYELPFSNNLEQLLQLEAGSNVNQPGRFVFPVIDGEPQVDEADYSLTPTTTVHRFYQHDKDFYLYTADETEVQVVNGRSAAGRQGYEYEYDGEQFRVLTSNRDEFTGELIEGAKPVHRYINTQTGSYFYTLNEGEMSYIDDNLTNYQKVVSQVRNSNQNAVDSVENAVNSLENTASQNQDLESIEFYAFESQDDTELPTIPVYRMRNSQSGAHYLTTSMDVATNLESQFPYFSMENNANPVFYVFEL